jgi:2-methylcitrate dehydratase PrpD
MSRREGGRAARRKKKATRSEVGAEPVRGGAYRPLAEADIEKIHQSALTVLEEVGMGDPTAELAELATASGCRMGDDGRLRFPKVWIEDLIATLPKRITLYGRSEDRDVELGAGLTHYATGGMAVRMVDMETGDYRPSTLQDLYDCARVVNALDNIHVFNRTCVASDIGNLREFDLSIAYACAAGTTKPLGVGFNQPSHAADAVEMFDLILGGEGRFRARPFATCNTCAVVPPLKFGEDNTVVAMAAARAGFPVKMTNAAQAGATAPAALAGTLVQTVAESLAGMAIVQLAQPGAPVIYANWPFVSDLRTGAFSGGGGEIALLNAASAQIARWYGFPNCVSAGMTDAKDFDAQLIAALLALCEARPAGFDRFADAYAVGLAAIVHVGRALGYGHYRRGWHATATLGPIGAACACARLLGLNVRGYVSAMSIATSRAAGMQLQFGRDAKAVQVGAAAQSGLEAALLAEAGLSGSPAVWDGPGGLLDLYGDGTAPGFTAASLDALSLSIGHIARKAYPCCHYAHRAIAAALSLDVSGDAIESGVVSLPQPFARVVAVEQPATPDQARFSVVYCVAVALADGRVDADSFSDSALVRADLRAISSRLRLESYSVPSQIADLSSEYADSVTVRMADGQELRSEQAIVPGGPESPLTVETLVEKACACFASGGVAENAQQALCDTLLHAPERRSVELLVAATGHTP